MSTRGLSCDAGLYELCDSRTMSWKHYVIQELCYLRTSCRVFRLSCMNYAFFLFSLLNYVLYELHHVWIMCCVSCMDYVI
jgi:hypothetical protein